MVARNVGPSDASLRWLFGAVLLAVGLMGAAGVVGTFTVGSLALAIVAFTLGTDLVLTAASHYSILYRLLGLKTLEKEA